MPDLVDWMHGGAISGEGGGGMRVFGVGEEIKHSIWMY